MAKKVLNKRCPLQAECERKCVHEGHELDCEYYANNGIGEDRTIPDQEEIRRERERKSFEADYDLLDDEDMNEELFATPGNMVYLPIEKLHPHPDNPRKQLGDLTELADSIMANGVFQNLTVVPDETGYTIIIGHRRHAASQLAGLTELPCVITTMTPKEQLSTMLLENMQRSDLTVYEQAQGFQMMLDLGSSVEEIAEKSGFSKSTVRRRVKMMELDQTTLKEVSDRQLSLADFDKLAQIEDISARNEVLRAIGTSNFNMEFERRFKAQRIAQNLPIFKEALRKSKAKKIDVRETWYGKYDEVRNTVVDIDKFEGGDVPIPECDEDLFYCLQEDIGRVRYYTKHKNPPPVKRSQEEIDRAKAIKAAHERCAELDELSRKLREDYVSGLSLSSKNRDAMLSGCVGAIISMGFKYGSVSSSKLCKLVGIERQYEAGEQKRAAELLFEQIDKVTPAIIYEAFSDNNEVYHTSYKQQWPAWQENLRLDLLYKWLTSVGYIMSDDEKAMQDGTHEVFQEGS